MSDHTPRSYVVVIEGADAADMEHIHDTLDHAVDKLGHLEGVEVTTHTTAMDASAAPDLFEALDEIEMIEPDEYGDRVVPAGFLDKARAAIAKATEATA